MRILIAVPTYENIYPDTFKSIYGLDGGEHELMFDFVRGYDVGTARNNIARLAMECESDYVLMVDNDVVLPQDALLHLIENNKDVCLGYYAHRDKRDNLYRGNTCICRIEDDNGNPFFGYPIESEYSAKHIQSLRKRGHFCVLAHGGGMGCALIKTSVFRSISFPYFAWANYDNGKNMSEDLHFCEQCHKAGIGVYFDTRVACGHVFRHIQFPV